MHGRTALAAAAASAGFMAWAVRGRSAGVFGRSVWRGPRDAPAMALTFDDGPSEGTPANPRNSRAARAPATFFQCGANVDRLPAVAREVPRRRPRNRQSQLRASAVLFLRSPAFIEDELRRAQEAIGAAYRRDARLVPRAVRRPLVRHAAARSGDWD